MSFVKYTITGQEKQIHCIIMYFRVIFLKIHHLISVSCLLCNDSFVQNGKAKVDFLCSEILCNQAQAGKRNEERRFFQSQPNSRRGRVGDFSGFLKWQENQKATAWKTILPSRRFEISKTMMGQYDILIMGICKRDILCSVLLKLLEKTSSVRVRCFRSNRIQI